MKRNNQCYCELSVERTVKPGEASVPKQKPVAAQSGLEKVILVTELTLVCFLLRYCNWHYLFTYCLKFRFSSILRVLKLFQPFLNLHRTGSLSKTRRASRTISPPPRRTDTCIGRTSSSAATSASTIKSSRRDRC